MSAIEIRRLSPDDWAMERDLRLAALTESPWAFGSALAETLPFNEADWRRRLDRQARFAAVRDGEPVGTVGCAAAEPPYPAGTTMLMGMWVRPAARGSGVADRLVDTIIAWSADQGRGTVWLSVSHGNEVAERLYLRHGFHRTGTDLEGDGDTFDMRLTFG